MGAGTLSMSLCYEGKHIRTLKSKDSTVPLLRRRAVEAVSNNTADNHKLAATAGQTNCLFVLEFHGTSCGVM